MTWVKLDDQFPIHRKVGALSDAAFRLHVEALCWSARNLTDGRIETEELRTVTRIGRAERYAAELVRWGAWRETETGWEIHDYLDYQQSRSKVLQTRELRAAAGKAGGKASGESRRKGGATGKTAGHRGQRSNGEAKPKHVALRSVEPPAPLLLSEGRTGRPPAERDGPQAGAPPQPPPPTPPDDVHNPDWRTLPTPRFLGASKPRANRLAGLAGGAPRCPDHPGQTLPCDLDHPEAPDA
jgi:hypothetical protein